ncbi:hypothetical protein [Micromonospora sp. WMMD736]|uniref:hypothetical protein n=1 Tax=Micromonospora sp. WMMD736 TaxID=3404112 RepID=UPI003B96376D
MTRPTAATPAPFGKRVADARHYLTELTDDLSLSHQMAFSDGIGLLRLLLDRLQEMPVDLTGTPAAANRIGALLTMVELCWIRVGGAGHRQQLRLVTALNQDIRDSGRSLEELLRLADPEGEPRTRRFRLLVETQQRALGQTADRVDSQVERLEEALRRSRGTDERLKQMSAEHELRTADLQETLDERVAELLHQERAAYDQELKRVGKLREEARRLSADLQVHRANLCTDDGTRDRERRQADRWRHVGIGFGLLGLVVLVAGALAHRNAPHWPTLVASLGITTTATYLMALCLRESAGHRAHERQLGVDQHYLAKLILAVGETDPEKRSDLMEQLFRKLMDGDVRLRSADAPSPEEQPVFFALLAQLLTALADKGANSTSPELGTGPRT